METLAATFRIVTPMFIAGADPDKAELRAPSIKGALRFWWRALQWGNVRDIAELRRKEAELFGSSETGQSKVLMRISPQLMSNTKPPTWKITDPNHGWKCYSGYGLHEGNRAFIRPGEQFDLQVSWNELREKDVSSIRSAIVAFGLLGGLGSRFRNAWGSVTLLNLEAWVPPQSRSDLVNAVQTLVSNGVANAPHMPPFTAFSEACEFHVGEMKPSSEAAQKALIAVYQSTKDKDSLVSKEDRVELGLPRLIKRTSFRRQNERRASPLLLHVHQVEDGKALPVVIWLPSSPWHPAVNLPVKNEGTAPRIIMQNASKFL